jgi:hypothetical protein
MVTDGLDYNKGLATLVIKKDNGRIASAKMTQINLTQKTEDVRFERLNIQRAYDVVVVTRNNTQYAIVSDDNLSFLDPYWRAMFEAPMFVFTSPFAPPTPIGGSASAKTVVVGGKLGIIKDPFGKAQFLGATAPQNEARYRDLSIVGDTLLVNTLGLFSGGGQTAAFSVGKLIDMAEAHAGVLSVSIGKTKPKDPPPIELTPVQTASPSGQPASSVSSWVGDRIEVIGNWFTGLFADSEKAPPQPPAQPGTQGTLEAAIRPGDVVSIDVPAMLAKFVKDNPTSEKSKEILAALGKKPGEAITAEELRGTLVLGWIVRHSDTEM